MGITDEEYARAIQENRIKQLELALKRKEQEDMLRTSAVDNDTNTISSNGTGTVIISTPGKTTTFTGSGAYTTPIGLKVITEENLQHDAMKAPLSALVDMWTMRWSGEWVNESEFDEDDFWRLALVRLLGANKLEKHNLANQYRSVYRIIE